MANADPKLTPCVTYSFMLSSAAYLIQNVGTCQDGGRRQYSQVRAAPPPERGETHDPGHGSERDGRKRSGEGAGRGPVTRARGIPHAPAERARRRGVRRAG